MKHDMKEAQKTLSQIIWCFVILALIWLTSGWIFLIVFVAPLYLLARRKFMDYRFKKKQKE